MKLQNAAIGTMFLCLIGCGAITSTSTQVQGAGENEFLKLRSGPGLGYNILLGLPDGTRLKKGTCVTELGQRWCKVQLQKAPKITGYVSADYIFE